MELALIVLLTGVVVVFSVLIVLIFVVKIYSTIVYNSTQKSKQKKELAEKLAKEKLAEETAKIKEPVVEIVQPDDDSIPDEVIAVIAAAVSSMYGSKAPKIRSVKRSSASRSAWGNAGLLENTRPF